MIRTMEASATATDNQATFLVSPINPAGRSVVDVDVVDVCDSQVIRLRYMY